MLKYTRQESNCTYILSQLLCDSLCYVVGQSHFCGVGERPSSCFNSLTSSPDTMDTVGSVE